MTVYGRFFKLYMYTALAPIPLSTFAGEPSQNVGKSFIKSYCAVCLEGAVIVLACIIFSLFAASPPVVNPDAAAVTQVWAYIGELLFNMLVLVGSVKMSDRIIREMMDYKGGIELEVKINREIRNYTEAMFFGLSLRQFIFSALACGVAVGLFFLLRPHFGTETLSWVCILGASPFAMMGFVKYNGMTAEQFVWAWIKSEFLMPKKLMFLPDNLYYEALKPTIEAREKGLPVPKRSRNGRRQSQRKRNQENQKSVRRQTMDKKRLEICSSRIRKSLLCRSRCRQLSPLRLSGRTAFFLWARTSTQRPLSLRI